jgi:hypothetical protein
LLEPTPNFSKDLRMEETGDAHGTISRDMTRQDETRRDKTRIKIDLITPNEIRLKKRHQKVFLPPLLDQEEK